MVLQCGSIYYTNLDNVHMPAIPLLGITENSVLKTTGYDLLTDNKINLVGNEQNKRGKRGGKIAEYITGWKV